MPSPASSVLVIQLARLGDLLQTRRLILSLMRYGDAGEPAQVHLLTDASLADFARAVYPGVTVHGLPAHGGADPGAVAGLCQTALSGLAAYDFARVYNINHSPLSLALSAYFDPDQVAGHKLVRGQAHKDTLAALALRWTRNRVSGAVNLMDYWAGFARMRIAPDAVNPAAAPHGGGLGVAVSGRNARRSPPPEQLAHIASVLAAKYGGSRVTLLGTAAEAPAARALAKHLPPRLREGARDLTGKTGLLDLAGEIGGLDALLTPDTGLMHLAAALGAPVTALFLSSAWCHETGPYGTGHTIWQAAPECAPCLEAKPCAFGLRCLETLKSPEFLRLIATEGRAPVPEGVAGYHSALDSLGALCVPFAGSDPAAVERARLRGLAGRFFGAGAFFDQALDPEAAAELFLETDYVLPGRGACPDREY
ncbi:MAG: glycosyltransferase family 9 protein [Desulfovibrionaceae bacterium]|nr:glycosyltransferase family 9 protein [Desulfovibrionaceae bacterium]MBF0515019.1 glycosyltransferase family 9 protein [Desulfovibrionaceae bacterium]